MTPSERKDRPVYSGVLKYFPDALLEVALVSKLGNDQHNPGQPLHWDRAKSTDELDAASRHLIGAGTRDDDGARHSAKLVWRALANLQKEIEAERAPKAYVQGPGRIFPLGGSLLPFRSPLSKSIVTGPAGAEETIRCRTEGDHLCPRACRDPKCACRTLSEQVVPHAVPQADGDGRGVDAFYPNWTIPCPVCGGLHPISEHR